MDETTARAWLSRFEDAERLQRTGGNLRGPEPGWAIEVALSMIDAVAHSSFPDRHDPVRAAGEGQVRETWWRLKNRQARP